VQDKHPRELVWNGSNWDINTQPGNPLGFGCIQKVSIEV
jgi:SLT domain-containing protein